MNDIKKSDTWEIQLMNFISSKDDNDEECVMHSESDKIKIMICDDADEVIKKKILIHLKIDINIIYNQ